MARITDLVPMRTGAYSVFPYSPGIVEAYSFDSKYPDAEGKTRVDMSRRVGESVWVPRNTAPIGEQDYRTNHVSAPLKPLMPPRNAQQAELIPKSVGLLRQGVDHVFEAPTGFGKTYIGGAIGCAMGQPTLIIVTKTDLLQSWKKDLVNLIGIPANEIGHIQANVCKWKGCRFVVAMVHSLIIEGKYEPEMFSYFGLVIFDEVHRMAADSFSKAGFLFSARHRIGLSATPKRKDGRSPLVEAHIGPTLVRATMIPMKPRVLLQNTGWKIPVQKKFKNGMMVEETIPHSPGQMMHIYNIMSRSEHRNSFIIKFADACYRKQRSVVLMSDTLEHLDNLFKLLLKFVPAEQIGYYTGKISNAQLEIQKLKPIVLATYSKAGEGTNVPEWDAMVMCLPRSDVKQIIGRVMRTMEGKKEPVILDLCDHNKIFQAFRGSRIKTYYEVGATIVNMDSL